MTVRLSLLVVFALGITQLGRSAAVEPEFGVTVGASLPNTSMRALMRTKRDTNVGLEEYDRNTCFAGKHRNDWAISLYAKQDTPALLKLAGGIDSMLAACPDLHAYVLLTEGNQFDAKLKTQLRRTWAERKFEGMQLAISGSTAAWQRRGIPQDAEVTIVLSHQRRVLFSRSFTAVEVAELDPVVLIRDITKLLPKE
jgi:hypothetical protein